MPELSEIVASEITNPPTMFGKKFEEFINSRQSTRIGMTTVERIPDNALRDSTVTLSARSSLSSEASVDSGFSQHPSSSSAAEVSTQAAKMFALAKTLEFMRSAHVLSNIRDAEGEEFREVCDEMELDEEIKTDDVKRGCYAESGIGSEMKSEASSDSEEEVIICETDEEELAQTGKRLVS